MHRLLRRTLLVVVPVALASCLSPTLPLPPPDRPSVSSPDQNGLVRIQGVASPRVEVIAWNHNNGLIAGQVTGSDAHYDFTLRGDVHDLIELWYAEGTNESQSITFKVPDAESP